MTIRVVSFDFTNTLARFATEPVVVYENVLRRRLQSPALTLSRSVFAAALKAQPANFGASVGMTTHQWWHGVVELCVRAVPREQLSAEATALWTRDQNVIVDELMRGFASSDAYELLPGVDSTLRALKAHDEKLKFAIISNNDSRLDAILISLHLDRHFDVVVTSAVERLAKPDAAIFHRALARCGLAVPGDAQHMLHVGDDERKDVEGAVAAGCRAVLVDRRAPASSVEARVAELRDSSRRRTTVQTIAQVSELVARINASADKCRGDTVPKK
jgi:REG-2-like HAD superfamily hydrolase